MWACGSTKGDKCRTALFEQKLRDSAGAESRSVRTPKRSISSGDRRPNQQKLFWYLHMLLTVPPALYRLNEMALLSQLTKAWMPVIALPKMRVWIS